VKQIRVDRSFIAADALTEVIAEEYDLDVTGCKLFSKMLRTQDNDHYLLRTGGGEKYVARVYQEGSHLERQEGDYQFELDWLNFLKRRDMPVSYPIARRDGRFLGSVNAPEGLRYYAVFSFANGKPMDLEDLDHLYDCGAKMAQIHVVSNDYQGPYKRQPMDLAFLVDRPVARLKRFWSEDPDRADDLDLLLTSAEEARTEIEVLVDNEFESPDSWGPIGGDFHSANTYFDDHNGPIFFNFDLCGYGWRAYDIATFLLNTNLMHTSTEGTEAFIAGYYSVRRLNENEHAAISPFLTIRRIWLTGSFARRRGLVGHTFIAPA
jgi:Ser/Thr protein kinase RdoA (MazF antagonist)